MINNGCKRYCETINRPAYIVLFKGDDSDFEGNQSVDIVIDTELDTTGMKAHFRFMDFVQDFDSIPENKTLSLVFPNAKTSEFPLGAADATLRFEDASGKFRTVSNRIHIVVTNSVHEAYDNEDSQSITVTVKGTVTWEMIDGKPTFAPVATSGSYNDLSDKPTIPDPVTIDTALSETSENPVQNKVVAKALYTGFTEWEFSGNMSPGVTYTVDIAEYEGAEGPVYIASLYGSDGSSETVGVDSLDALTILFSGSGITATRHLITPTKTSQLTNDSGFLTQHQDISGKLDGVAAYPAWSTGVYPVGTVRSYNGRLYQLVYSIVNQLVSPDSAPWWEEKTIDELKQDALSFEQLANIAAVPQKANTSDLPYAMVTPGAWEFAPYPDGVTSVEFYGYSSGDGWEISVNGDAPVYAGLNEPNATELEWDVHGDGTCIITATRASLPGHLLDRANNLIDATTGNVTLTLPPFQEGKVRDLLVHVNLGDDGTDPYNVTVNFPTGETNTGFKVKGNASAPLPAPDAAGEWLFSFSESSPHKMAVSLAQLQDATAGGS